MQTIHVCLYYIIIIQQDGIGCRLSCRHFLGERFPLPQTKFTNSSPKIFSLIKFYCSSPPDPQACLQVSPLLYSAKIRKLVTNFEAANIYYEDFVSSKYYRKYHKNEHCFAYFGDICICFSVFNRRSLLYF